MIRIPVGESASQRFTVEMEGEPIEVGLRYSHLNGCWSINLRRNGDLILTGQRLVTGTDLFRAYNFRLGMLFLSAAEGPGVDPGRDDLAGDDPRVILVHMSEAERATIRA